MQNLKPNDNVRVKPEAKDVPEEARGKEGIIMVPDPSRIGFRTPGSSYETADDGAVIWLVHFPALGATLSINEIWLDPVDPV